MNHKAIDLSGQENGLYQAGGLERKANKDRFRKIAKSQLFMSA